jgi:SAM-dependent methyltransferase
MDSHQLDEILWRHLSSLPYFRGFLRAVEDRFYQEIPLVPPVLDLGSGDGHFASVAFDHRLDVGLDPWSAPMKEAQQRGAYRLLVLGEGASIPFEDGFFATVTSTSVLEHIPDLDPVFQEVARVLKPGGKFVFCVPNHRFPEALWGRRFLTRIGCMDWVQPTADFSTALPGMRTPIRPAFGRPGSTRLALSCWIPGIIFRQKLCMFWNGGIP